VDFHPLLLEEGEALGGVVVVVGLDEGVGGHSGWLRFFV